MQLGIGDEVQLQLQGTMAAMGVTKGQLDAATRAAIGLSEALGMGLEEASKLAAKALTGNVAALAEFGIKTTSVADAQRQLNGLYEIALQQSTSLETRLKALDAAYGDFKETLGGAVTQSTAAKEGIDAVTLALTELQSYFASAEGRQAVNAFFGVVLDLAGQAIDAMLGAYKLAQELRGEGDRTSMLSRAGGALGLAGSVGVFGAVRSLVTGKSMMQEAREDLDQLLGRGESNLQQSPMLLALENMADRLKKAGQEARNAVMEPPLLNPDGSRYKPESPAGTTPPAKTGKGKARTEELAPAMHLADPFASPFAERLAEAEKQAAELRSQLQLEAFDLAMVAQTEQAEARYQAQLDAYNREQEAVRTHYDTLKQMTAQGANIVSGSISDLIVAWASGADMAEMTVGRFVGTILMQLGTMLIQTSVAAGVLGLLSFIPGLQGIAGAPGLGLAAGAAAFTAGVAMVGLGAAMGGGGARGGASAAPRGAPGGAARAPEPRGFDPMQRGFGGIRGDMAAAPSYTVNVSFGVVGDERRAARMIRDVLERGR
jgi:hypothetical protein